MSIPGRDQSAALRGLAIYIALVAILVATATVSADTYAPFCEAPIQQCANEDRGPHDSGGSIQLYPHWRCAELSWEITVGLTGVVLEQTSDPHAISRVAAMLHEVAHHCPADAGS